MSSAAPPERMSEALFDQYDTEGFYDEMFEDHCPPRPKAELLAQRLDLLAEGELPRRQKAADRPC